MSTQGFVGGVLLVVCACGAVRGGGLLQNADFAQRAEQDKAWPAQWQADAGPRSL